VIDLKGTVKVLLRTRDGWEKQIEVNAPGLYLKYRSPQRFVPSFKGPDLLPDFTDNVQTDNVQTFQWTWMLTDDGVLIYTEV
jgi:hypothetical protein